MIAKLQLPLASILISLGERKECALPEQMDEFSDCFQKMGNRSANMLWTHFGKCLVLSGDENRGKQFRVRWLRGLGASFPHLVKSHRKTSEGPTNLLQIQAIITGVRLLLKEDEQKEDKLRRLRRAKMRKVIAAPE